MPKATMPKNEFVKCSACIDDYTDFNSCEAINAIVDMENEHQIDFSQGVSKYYGTVWRENAETLFSEDSMSQYQRYLDQLGEVKPDSLHCTIYAYKGLASGLTKNQLKTLEGLHKRIWKSREIAGWSIGYILVKHFNWKAYLIIDPDAKEYQHCLQSYRRNKTYPVWKQPNIPLKRMYVRGKDNDAINELLAKNEFGWGFSEQGIHTWVTRYQELKECNWLGSPSIQFEDSDDSAPLFITTNFEEYIDYNSHVVIFPPKELDSN